MSEALEFPTAAVELRDPLLNHGPFRPIYVVNEQSWGGTVGELWRCRELVWFFVWRDVAIKYKQTFFGIAWAVLQPLCAMIVFTLLFGRVAKLPSEGVPHPVFYYAGLLPWTLFTAGVVASGNSLIANTNLLTKVYFPRIALPTSAVLAGLIDYAVASVVLLVLLLCYGVGTTWQLLLLPILTVPVVAATLGAGLFLSALNVKYRDIKYVLPFLTQLGLFLTPVIYPLSMLPETYRPWMLLNPLAGSIESLRAAVLGHSIEYRLLGASCVVSALLLITGYVFFRRSERQFADLI